MDLFDPIVVAQSQFPFTISFHITFPAFSIGLASYLAVRNGLHLATGRSVFIDLFNYTRKIFAVAFGKGGSARLCPLVEAEGLAEIHAKNTCVTAGDTVLFHPFRDGFAV